MRNPRTRRYRGAPVLCLAATRAPGPNITLIWRRWKRLGNFTRKTSKCTGGIVSIDGGGGSRRAYNIHLRTIRVLRYRTGVIPFIFLSSECLMRTQPVRASHVQMVLRCCHIIWCAVVPQYVVIMICGLSVQGRRRSVDLGLKARSGPSVGTPSISRGGRFAVQSRWKTPAIYSREQAR